MTTELYATHPPALGLENSSLTNMSDQLSRQRLDYLQEQTTRTMIPAMTFLTSLAILGLLGNTLVLLVYSKNFTQTPTRVFIMAIAGFDLVTNVVVTPGEIYDMFHIWDFTNASLCAARLFFSAFTTIAAAITLLAVAVVRYLKVCKPFGRQVTVRQSKIIAVAMAACAFVFALPTAILNGRQTKETPWPELKAHECTTDDRYVDTIWPLVNTGIFLLLFLSCCVPLIVLYILIGIQAWRHSKVYGVSSPTKPGPSTTGVSHSSTSAPYTKSTDDSASTPMMQMKEGVRCDPQDQHVVKAITAENVGNGIELEKLSENDGGNMEEGLINCEKTETVRKMGVEYQEPSKTKESPDKVELHLAGSLKEARQHPNEETGIILDKDTGFKDGNGNGSEGENSEGQPCMLTGLSPKVAGKLSERGNCSSDKTSTASAKEIHADNHFEDHKALKEEIKPEEYNKKKTENSHGQIDFHNMSSTSEIGHSLDTKKQRDTFKVKSVQSLTYTSTCLVVGESTVETGKGNSSSFWEKLIRKGKYCPGTSKDKAPARAKGGKRKAIGRTTCMLIFITVIYILSYVPHLAMMFFKFTSPETFAAMDMTGLSFYNLFLRFYFLSSATNPVIYSLCDVNFRRHSMAVVRCGWRNM